MLDALPKKRHYSDGQSLPLMRRVANEILKGLRNGRAQAKSPPLQPEVSTCYKVPFHAVAGAQQLPQQGYKGLGTAGVVSSQGDLLTRTADAGMIATVGGAATDAFMDSAAPEAATGVVEGMAGVAGAQQGIPDWSAGTEAGGAGAGGLEEPAKAVSMDGDIIGTAVSADALKAAADSSAQALPGESPSRAWYSIC